MFVLTVIFGLYHGLVLLPVLLSLFGPVDQSSRNNVIQPGASISNEENVLSQEHKFDPEQVNFNSKRALQKFFISKAFRRRKMRLKK